MSDGHFEAKVHARRETKDGVYITLSVNPADLTPDLAMLRVGSALMVGWSEVVDTEVHHIEIARQFDAATGEEVSGMVRGQDPEVLAQIKFQSKDRRPFTSLPLSQQAAIRCQDNDFRTFLARDNDRVRMWDTETAADLVREACGVSSRSEIVLNTPAGDKWEALEREYQAWLTQQKYGESYR